MTPLLIIYGVVVAALTLAEWRQQSRAQYILKPLAALGFIGLAVYAGALNSGLGSAYGLLILAALVFCAIGDVALLVRDKPKLFLLGMAAFGVGHAVYVAAFASQEMSGPGLLGGLSLGLTMTTMFIIFIWRHVPRDMRLPVGGYLIIIMAMLAAASGIAYARDIWIVWIAAVMFAVSDVFVSRDRFVIRARWHPFIITPLYFGAQALFALSVSWAL